MSEIARTSVKYEMQSGNNMETLRTKLSHVTKKALVCTHIIQVFAGAQKATDLHENSKIVHK